MRISLVFMLLNALVFGAFWFLGFPIPEALLIVSIVFGVLAGLWFVVEVLIWLFGLLRGNEPIKRTSSTHGYIYGDGDAVVVEDPLWVAPEGDPITPEVYDDLMIPDATRRD